MLVSVGRNVYSSENPVVYLTAVVIYGQNIYNERDEIRILGFASCFISFWKYV